jgi:hypothetical protein
VVGTSAELARVRGIHIRIQREIKEIRSEVSVEISVGDIYKIRYKCWVSEIRTKEKKRQSKPV